MSPKRDEMKMTIGIPQKLYEAMLEVSTKNKFENIKQGMRSVGKKPSTMTELVRIACEEKYLKKK